MLNVYMRPHFSFLDRRALTALCPLFSVLCPVFYFLLFNFYFSSDPVSLSV